MFGPWAALFCLYSQVTSHANHPISCFLLLSLLSVIHANAGLQLVEIAGPGSIVRVMTDRRTV